MKKILSLAIILTTPFFVNAQNGDQSIDKEIFRICATIFVIGLVMLFIILILKRILDYRLKNKIVENGIPENVISSILQTAPKENGDTNIKWFSILAGLGVGLIIVNYTQPLGIHSFAIMALCISVSFLGYYFFLKKTEK